MTGRRWLLLIGLLIAGGVVSTRYLKVNLSPSVPVGLYWLRSVPPTLDRGMLVVLPVPASVRAIHGSIPLLKPVAAVAGDVVCQQQHRVMLIRLRGADLGIPGVDGWLPHEVGQVYDAWNGQALPQALPDDGCLIVPAGSVFLASPMDRSLDSRYFGPVRIADLTGQAVPLVTW